MGSYFRQGPAPKARYDPVRRRKNEMYNKTLTAAFAVAILGSGAAFAADKPGADWITLEQAVEKAKAAGYTELHGIEADGDGWEGEGMKQDGKKYEFKIDGRTGEVTKDKED
ncbi:predicted membrane protein [Stutzerimonas stutzeri A1501]|uniref:Predicted membrane protein n=2 Tax=Stutzerimonas stutzeri TaxID=316 RepID=A4VHV2_STUS1|nr:predicted membrane protein [Stutzerimonas stutzeri A1501]